MIETVATAIGSDPLHLQPLYDSIDPEALDGLLEPKVGQSRTDVRITFRFEGCDVTVSANGETIVSPPDHVRP
ncbi:hypothetical protein CP556_09885 [Natrinema sp. CBA1119]|nr:hypothetical protein CP556_09885 [Natrinema sp. CBA1119]